MVEFVIPALIGGVFGVLAAAIPIYIANRRLPAKLTNEAVALVGAGVDVSKVLGDENERLAKRVETLERQNRRYTTRINALEYALRRAGINPNDI